MELKELFDHEAQVLIAKELFHHIFNEVEVVNETLVFKTEMVVDYLLQDVQDELAKRYKVKISFKQLLSALDILQFHLGMELHLFYDYNRGVFNFRYEYDQSCGYHYSNEEIQKELLNSNKLILNNELNFSNTRFFTAENGVGYDLEYIKIQLPQESDGSYKFPDLISGFHDNGRAIGALTDSSNQLY